MVEFEFSGSSMWDNKVSSIVILSCLFHVWICLLVVSFYRALTTPPGHPPATKRWKEGLFDITDEEQQHLQRIVDIVKLDKTIETLQDHEVLFLKSLPIIERYKELEYRYCREEKCKMYKPDRTHHCRVCNTCVLRMDHHCMWVNNCIGFNNYKHFLLMVFYFILCLAFVVIYLHRRFMQVFIPLDKDWHKEMWLFLLTDVPLAIIYVLSTLMLVILSIYFVFHFYMLLSALTSIEMHEKRNSTNSMVRLKFLISHIKFDHGMANNFCHVFGPMYMWFLPVAPPMQYSGDGTYYDVSEHIYN